MLRSVRSSNCSIVSPVLELGLGDSVWPVESRFCGVTWTDSGAVFGVIRILDAPPFTCDPAVKFSMDAAKVGSGDLEIDIDGGVSLDSGAEVDSSGTV